MRGNKGVIKKLNEALWEELTAIVQYFVHAEMCDNWGCQRMGTYCTLNREVEAVLG